MQENACDWSRLTSFKDPYDGSFDYFAHQKVNELQTLVPKTIKLARQIQHPSSQPHLSAKILALWEQSNDWPQQFSIAAMPTAPLAERMKNIKKSELYLEQPIINDTKRFIFNQNSYNYLCFPVKNSIYNFFYSVFSFIILLFTMVSQKVYGKSHEFYLLLICRA